MPRKKMAAEEAIVSEIASGIQRMCDALVQARATKAISRRLRDLEDEYKIWTALLDLRQTKSKKELREILHVDPKHVAKKCRGLRIAVDDLGQLREMFDALAHTIIGKRVELKDPQRVLSLLRRMVSDREPRIKRFKPEFEEGFRLMEEARTRGEVITAENLAKQLRPDDYDRNPESTIRGMQQGIDRVRKEHNRLLSEKIPSPFLSAGEHQNPN